MLELKVQGEASEFRNFGLRVLRVVDAQGN